ncbi:hypothetical protein [Paenibacillus sp.]|uniref:hypothetical protein n=1 Tax=Paenibacillus sp. TaxID=58172 RepID=UPI002D231D8D|nr:hypothetical protein [Paenibacillus sp.]HZG58628.1 hypothetical protein [Paenibacillus sp.]
MMRWFGWLIGLILAAACVAALAGWTPAASSARAASAAAVADVARLSALADGVLAEEGRLWVVTARTNDGLLRWSGADAGEAARWIERTAETLPTGSSALWFVNAQGRLAAGVAIADVPARVADGADATLVETYADGDTFSYAYDAPAFGARLGEGGGAVSLQAAAHRDTESGAWRVTLGTPVVMMEY